MTPEHSSVHRACNTSGCEVIPPLGFGYCEKHAGSEREAYETLRAAEREAGWAMDLLDRAGVPRESYEAQAHGVCTWTLAGRVDHVVRQRDQLRAAIEDYRLWEPRKAGHAAAHARLMAALGDTDA